MFKAAMSFIFLGWTFQSFAQGFPYEGKWERVIVRCVNNEDGRVLYVEKSDSMSLELQGGHFHETADTNGVCEQTSDVKGSYKVVNTHPWILQMKRTKSLGCERWIGDDESVSHEFTVENTYLVHKIRKQCKEFPDSHIEWLYALLLG